jgi:hypothetical protein
LPTEERLTISKVISISMALGSIEASCGSYPSSKHKQSRTPNYLIDENDMIISSIRNTMKLIACAHVQEYSVRRIAYELEVTRSTKASFPAAICRFALQTLAAAEAISITAICETETGSG